MHSTWAFHLRSLLHVPFLHPYKFNNGPTYINVSLTRTDKDALTCFVCLFTETMAWENVVMDQYDDSIPRARAGHCSVAVSLKFLCDCMLSISLSEVSSLKSLSEKKNKYKVCMWHIVSAYMYSSCNNYIICELTYSVFTCITILARQWNVAQFFGMTLTIRVSSVCLWMYNVTEVKLLLIRVISCLI